MAKTLTAVRDVEAFTKVVLNLPFELQARNSALRSRALEADRAIIRSNSLAGGSNICDGNSSLVDQDLQNRGETHGETRVKRVQETVA